MNHAAPAPIGVFDSGLGGLTVLKELLKELPNEQIIYLGDTARVPYGNKSLQTVTRYSFENTRFLLKKGIKLLIVACNTASAYSIEAVKGTFSVPCLGVIQPGARAAVQNTLSGKVAIIGTSGTISSQAYPRAIKDLAPEIIIYEKACPLLVPLVEEGWIDHEVTEIIIRTYLESMTGRGIDTMILGCTHYPLLKTVISRIMGPDVKLVDSAEETAKETKKLLKGMNILAPQDINGGYRLFVTDLPQQFARVAKLFLGEDLVPVDQVTLDEIV